jgi:hypothetical protein
LTIEEQLKEWARIATDDEHETGMSRKLAVSCLLDYAEKSLFFIQEWNSYEEVEQLCKLARPLTEDR